MNVDCKESPKLSISFPCCILVGDDGGGDDDDDGNKDDDNESICSMGS